VQRRDLGLVLLRHRDLLVVELLEVLLVLRPVVGQAEVQHRLAQRSGHRVGSLPGSLRTIPEPVPVQPATMGSLCRSR
jgi:hypothetical protein